MCGAWESNPAPSLRVKLPYHQNTTLVMLRDEFFSYSFIESVLTQTQSNHAAPRSKPNPNLAEGGSRFSVGDEPLRWPAPVNYSSSLAGTGCADGQLLWRCSGLLQRAPAVE